MKRILILNLTRMGDLLMTTPLIENLRNQEPDIEISVLSNKKFSEVCKYNPFIDNLYELDIHQFADNPDGTEISFLAVYRYINDSVEKMRSLRFDTLINLTHSKLSAVLSSLLDIPDVRGFRASKSGHRLVNNMWMVYFCNLLFNRQYNLFHLVDIYLKSGDITKNKVRNLTFHIPDSSSAWLSSYLDSNRVSDKTILIAFQPASSRPDRRWPAKYFTGLAKLLLRDERVKIIILGIDSEAELGREITEELNPERVINAVGKTTIPRLGAILERSDFLVTNDTGTMHIASAVGCRIVALFFTHALVHETGPYGEGHVVFQSDIPCSPCSHQTRCNNMVCKEYITPEDVFRVISTLIRGGDISDLRKRSDFSGKARLFVSGFSDDGVCEFTPVLKKNIRITDIMGYSYRELWKSILGDSAPPDDSGSVTARRLRSFFHTDNFGELAPYIDTITDSFLRLADESKRGLNSVTGILGEAGQPAPNLTKIKALANIVSEIDAKIEQTGLNTPETNPLVKMFSFGKENLEGEDYISLAEKTADLYRSLRISSHAMARNLESLKMCLWRT